MTSSELTLYEQDIRRRTLELEYEAAQQQGLQQSCSCPSCVSYCQKRPGWFKPGEIEQAAALLRISVRELFDEYLWVDYWTGEQPVYVLGPRTSFADGGEKAPYDPRGRCVFLTNDNRCSIHAAKPFECRMVWHMDKDPNWHQQAMDAWNQPQYQAQIEQLLGRTPKAPDPSIFDMLNWLNL